jgi:hypothetical protein
MMIHPDSLSPDFSGIPVFRLPSPHFQLHASCFLLPAAFPSFDAARFSCCKTLAGQRSVQFMMIHPDSLSPDFFRLPSPHFQLHASCFVHHAFSFLLPSHLLTQPGSPIVKRWQVREAFNS